ncbi:MAG: hypothetical protein SW833_26860 [Cyanobacteriota bacterium]|nr:hypothetical protein [Cyanobacteriota bacterium]
MENPDNPNPTPPQTLQQQYQEALLQSGIQAAQLLKELIDLKIMPDPRAKEMAEVALKTISLINSAPNDILKFPQDNPQNPTN